jgi:hypothetical protein
MTIKMEDYTSRWDFMADRAGVSRGPIHGSEPTPFQIVGRFIGNWQSEVNCIIERCNGGRGFNFLNKLSKNTDVMPYTYELDKADMDLAGIPQDAIFVNKINPKLLNEMLADGSIPTIKKMIDWFGFTGKVLPKIHIQHPGQVFPFHFDDLTTHRNNSDQSLEVDASPDSFARIEVQLKAWDYGHVWGIGNNYWSNWQAGEIMWHPWYNVPHGTANSGRTPRINLQITGGTTPELLERLQRNNGEIIL